MSTNAETEPRPPNPFERTDAPEPEPEPEETRPTSEDVLGSLTGYDEIAIEKAFGGSVGHLARTNASTFSRALVFATFLHAGEKHEDARKHALSLTINEINETFAPDEDDDELPGSETGKDES